MILAPWGKGGRQIEMWMQEVSKLLNNAETLNLYSSTSTIVGWASYTTKIIEYVKFEKLVTVWFTIAGVSNATGASFTLPYASANTASVQFATRAYDNSSTLVAGLGILAPGSDAVSLYPDMEGNDWTAANNKYSYGQFSYFSSE